MKIKDVMTANSIKYCNPETKLQSAAKTMKVNNCKVLPVVDKDKKVLGLITDRDIALSLSKKQETSFEKITVGQIMPSKFHAVKTDDHISAAFRQMRTNKVGRLPVVNEQGKLKGIISLHNLINKSISKGKEEFGDISSPGENLLKTIHAVTNRYNGVSASALKTVSAVKKVKIV